MVTQNLKGISNKKLTHGQKWETISLEMDHNEYGVRKDCLMLISQRGICGVVTSF